MRCERTPRLGRTRPADGQSNNSETLSRIQFLADYTIDTLESSFQKRHAYVYSIDESQLRFVSNLIQNMPPSPSILYHCSSCISPLRARIVRSSRNGAVYDLHAQR